MAVDLDLKGRLYVNAQGNKEQWITLPAPTL